VILHLGISPSSKPLLCRLKRDAVSRCKTPHHPEPRDTDRNDDDDRPKKPYIGVFALSDVVPH